MSRSACLGATVYLVSALGIAGCSPSNIASPEPPLAEAPVATPGFGMAEVILPSSPKGAMRLGDVPIRHPTATVAHFPAEGKTLLSASYQDVREWDLATKTLVRRYRLDGVYARELTTTSDGRYLVVRDWDSIVIINRVDGKLVHKVRTERAEDRIESCAVSPDAKMLATGTLTGHIRVCLLPTGEQLPFKASHPMLKPVQRPPMRVGQPKHPPRITHLAFSTDSRTIASAADGDTIRAWDVATANELWALDPKLSRSGPVAFSPDGKHLLAPKLVSEEKKNERQRKGACGVGGYALWSVADRSLVLELDGEVWPYHIAFSLDGRLIAEGGGFSRFSVKDASTGAERFNA
jgi:WD40 repeat protein